MTGNTAYNNYVTEIAKAYNSEFPGEKIDSEWLGTACEEMPDEVRGLFSFGQFQQDVEQELGYLHTAPIVAVSALTIEAKRIGIAPTDSSDGVIFVPVSGRDDLIVWIDQEAVAYKSEELLGKLKAFSANPTHDARENYEAVCLEIQDLETFEVETQEDNETYQLCEQEA